MGKLTPPTSLAALALNKAESWAARRATWRLANRGDTRVAAEKRFFKLEMKSLRRELQLADLLDRRAEYVAQREAASTARQVLSPAELAAQREAAAARRQTRIEQKDKSEARRLKAKALSREQAVRAVARREAIKTEEKEAWIEAFLKENDVSGKRATGWAGAGRKMAQVRNRFGEWPHFSHMSDPTFPISHILILPGGRWHRSEIDLENGPISPICRTPCLSHLTIQFPPKGQVVVQSGG